MKPVIIFATIFFNGQVENLQYKQVSQGFDTEKICYEYIEKHGDNITTSLEQYMVKVYPNGLLLVFGCSDRITFANEK